MRRMQSETIIPHRSTNDANTRDREAYPWGMARSLHHLVADRLFAVDVITNADVSEAVHQVLQSMFGKAAVA